LPDAGSPRYKLKVRGLLVDRSEAERRTLGQIIGRYCDEIVGEESEKRGGAGAWASQDRSRGSRLRRSNGVLELC
jgi:hypothetical protein